MSVQLTGDFLDLLLNGVSLRVSADEARRIVLERLAASESSIAAPGIVVPKIGTSWAGQGGIYTGIVCGRDDGPDYHLITGPEYGGDIDWQSAVDWVKSLNVDGHADFDLAWRPELSLQYANVPGLFKPRTYWSREQHAFYSDDAWSQNFDDGGQGYWDEGYELRARAVRRLAIHPFSHFQRGMPLTEAA